MTGFLFYFLFFWGGVNYPFNNSSSINSMITWMLEVIIISLFLSLLNLATGKWSQKAKYDPKAEICII